MARIHFRMPLSIRSIERHEISLVVSSSEKRGEIKVKNCETNASMQSRWSNQQRIIQRDYHKFFFE